MTKTAEQVLSDAMALDEAERAEVAARLLDTLDPATDADYASAWEAEIESRLRDLDERRVKTVPWEQAREQIRRGGADAESR